MNVSAYVNESKIRLALSLRIFQFLFLPLDLLILVYAVTSLINVYKFQLDTSYLIQVRELACSFCFSIFVTQDTKILCGLLIYSLTSLGLGLLAQYGLYSRRRLLLLPHWILISFCFLLSFYSTFLLSRPLWGLMAVAWFYIGLWVSKDKNKAVGVLQFELFSIIRTNTAGTCLDSSLVLLIQSWGERGASQPPQEESSPVRGTTCPRPMKKLKISQ